MFLDAASSFCKIKARQWTKWTKMRGEMIVAQKLAEKNCSLAKNKKASNEYFQYCLDFWIHCDCQIYNKVDEKGR